jgi:TRAP-type uncharacterized transport system fused permease subunit
MYFGMMSMITPPVAIGAFAAATLSGSDPMRTGYAAMRFGWLAFVIPFMFVISPTLLMQGRPFFVVFNFLTALVGTCLVSMAVIGYFLRRLGLLDRLIFAGTGLALLYPTAGFKSSIMVNLLGLVVAILIAGREFFWRYRSQAEKIS